MTSVPYSSVCFAACLHIRSAAINLFGVSLAFTFSRSIKPGILFFCETSLLSVSSVSSCKYYKIFIYLAFKYYFLFFHQFPFFLLHLHLFSRVTLLVMSRATSISFSFSATDTRSSAKKIPGILTSPNDTPLFTSCNVFPNFVMHRENNKCDKTQPCLTHSWHFIHSVCLYHNCFFLLCSV